MGPQLGQSGDGGGHIPGDSGGGVDSVDVDLK